MITIFSSRPRQSERRSSAVAVSLLLHSVVIVVVAVGATYSHKDLPADARKYTVRFIHLQSTEETVGLAGIFRSPLPGRALVPEHRLHARQTLVRPDVPRDVLLNQELTVPAVLLSPQSSLAALSLPNLRVPSADLFSIPNVAVRPQELLVVPPVNEVAGVGGDSQPDASRATRKPGSPDPANPPGLVSIEQPKDGKFGIVVSGSSASDEIPESTGALTGKVVYTVYVSVGLPKSWMLQYCLPNGVEQGTAAVDAPWPFHMMRPDALTSSDYDYILVRGTITSSGRFEQLALVYPSELAEHEKLLTALEQWTFRPGSRDGQPVAMEALLVIPGQRE